MRTAVLKKYDEGHIQAAMDIIVKDPKKHFTIRDLAEKVGVSEFKLKIGFHVMYNQTPYQYRLSLLFEKATEMLEVTDDTVDQISHRLGFRTRDGFTRAFKREFNQSPTEWRKMKRCN